MRRQTRAFKILFELVLYAAQSLFLILKIQVGQFAQSVYNNSEELGMFREKTLCECRYLGRRS